MNENIVISKSKNKCVLCGGNKWICWDLTLGKPISFKGSDDIYVDMDLVWSGKRFCNFVDECASCHAVVS